MTPAEMKATASSREGVKRDDAAEAVDAADAARQDVHVNREVSVEPRSGSAEEGHGPRLTLVDLNELVRRLAPRLGRILRKHRSLSLLLCRDIGLIVADAKELEQLLIDVTLRARTKDKGGGTLTILTRLVAPGTPGLPDDHSCDPPKRYVALEAYYTGDAAPETTFLPRVF